MSERNTDEEGRMMMSAPKRQERGEWMTPGNSWSHLATAGHSAHNQITVSNKCDDDYEDYHQEDEESDAGTSNSHTDQCPLRREGG